MSTAVQTVNRKFNLEGFKTMGIKFNQTAKQAMVGIVSANLVNLVNGQDVRINGTTETLGDLPLAVVRVVIVREVIKKWQEFDESGAKVSQAENTHDKATRFVLLSGNDTSMTQKELIEALTAETSPDSFRLRHAVLNKRKNRYETTTAPLWWKSEIGKPNILIALADRLNDADSRDTESTGAASDLVDTWE